MAQLAARDPDDVPLLQLGASQPRGVIITADDALIDLGYAPRPWLAGGAAR